MDVHLERVNRQQRIRRFFAKGGDRYGLSSSTGIDKLSGTLNESIADVQKTFANLVEPTPKQRVLRAKLDTIMEEIA